MTESAAQTKSGRDVLVVDDSSTIRRSAEIFLKQAGYSVRLAEDGFEALSSIVQIPRTYLLRHPHAQARWLSNL